MQRVHVGPVLALVAYHHVADATLEVLPQEQCAAGGGVCRGNRAEISTQFFPIKILKENKTTELLFTVFVWTLFNILIMSINRGACLIQGFVYTR